MNFIGVKIVQATPMTKEKFYGYPLDTLTRGYKVEYVNGYISWCPKADFDRANLPFLGSNKVTQADVDGFIDDTIVKTIGNKTTFVQVILKNGFSLEECSSCVDPANYDEAMGVKICMKKIKDKIWSLLGFLLQSATYGFDGGYNDAR